ncbi:hypothetical protein [Anaeromicrobium sediminis]|uniref:Zinc/iron-chelating domain-containing protein n=1 Tax=Anaeromicrobium sediminis TaxID=1478221 RepID=A0A267ME74_9FIRM|nr:hypothetical protein [Anaeromicrobium sediminis]PAB57881.1 hypothetical protein CCE28_17955 [Anaeromicrobium sediminis]
MDYKSIYEKAYELMDVQLIDGDCGKLCNHHCCRTYDGEEKMGIYLMPYEYESMLRNSEFSENLKVERHTSFEYDIPHNIGYVHYIYCEDEFGCFRHLRPIQCRTYPFEPHMEKGKLYLIIEKDQIHNCPLIDKMDQWREEFIRRIYLGWKELIKIKKVRLMVEFDSKQRYDSNNIKIKLSESDILI